MPDLLLDPFIVCLDANATSNEIESFIQRAISWSQCEERTGCRVVTSNKCLSVLYEIGLYPGPNLILDLFERVIHSDIYDPNTVIRSIDGLLNTSSKIEDILQIQDVLLDNNSAPKEGFFERLNLKLTQAFIESLASCSLYEYKTNINPILGIASNEININSVNCNFSITYFESSEWECDADLPELTIVLPVLKSIPEVYGILPFETFCKNYDRALYWSWVRDIPDQDKDSHKIGSYKFREEFTIEGLNLDIQKELFRKLVHLLCGYLLPGLQIEPLRISSGPNSKQDVRESDGAKAFRMQISQHGAGYHVLYWQLGAFKEITLLVTEKRNKIPR
jgi:hypothetical protein